jgi:hypothetical protein
LRRRTELSLHLNMIGRYQLAIVIALSVLGIVLAFAPAPVVCDG